MIIKEYYPTSDGFYVILRRQDYAHSLVAILELYQTAQEDLGEILLADVKIQHYGGQRYRGTFGIEFTTEAKPPEEYALISSPELTL